MLTVILRILPSSWYASCRTEADHQQSSLSMASTSSSSLEASTTQSSSINLSFSTFITSTTTPPTSTPTNAPTLSSHFSVSTASSASTSPSVVSSATTPSSASSHSQRVETIVGSVVAGIVATVVLPLAFFLCRRRRIASARPMFQLHDPGIITPFTDRFDHSQGNYHRTTGPVRPYRRQDDSLSIDMAEIVDRGSEPSASPPVPLPPSLDLPSVLDIHAGTRTFTTAPASPRSSISGIMANLRREEVLQDIADRLGMEMKSAGRKIARPRAALRRSGITPDTGTIPVVPFLERPLRRF